MRPAILGLGLSILLAVVLVGRLGAQAAGRGSLSGLVTDTNGAAVPSASVTLTNVATGVEQRGKTSSAGRYSFVSLIPGTYRLTVSQKDFQTTIQNNISVSVDLAETVNVTLKVGVQSQTVTVSAANDILDTTSSTTGQLITRKMIDRLPLSSRDVFQLAILSPGITPMDGNSSSIDTGRDQISNFTINGAQQGTVYYMLDGSPLTIGENNQGVVIPAFQPALDAIDEFRMNLNVTPASIQSGAAGVISLVSKSGTNQFHGDAFFWIQPNGLVANNYFNNLNGVPLPEFHRYQEGGSLGGPIKKGKFFFFGDWEGTQQATAEQLTTTVPTAAEKSGDFSKDTQVQLYNPFNFGTNCPSGSPSPCPQPLLNNKLPASGPGSINPVSQKYLQYWPAPTGPGVGIYHQNNWFGAGSAPENEQRWDIRLDDALTQNQRLFGRISIHRMSANGVNFWNNPFFNNNGSNIDATDHDGDLLIGHDWTINSSTVLQLRGSAIRHDENNYPPGELNYNITQLGFPASLQAASVYPTIPAIFINGAGGMGGQLGDQPFSVFKFAVTVYDFSATLDKLIGHHQLSMGWDFQRQYMNVGQPVSPSGYYQFDADATSNDAVAGGGGGDGDGFASFLMGVGSFNQGQSNWTTDLFGANANSYSGTFIQDNWQPLQRLTINAGLRWDVFPGATERHNRMEYFDSTLGYSLNGVPMTGGEVFSTPKHRSPYVTNWRDFAPRLGMTYMVTPHFVVRGGFGISYGPSIHMASINQFNDDSFDAQTTWVAGVPDASDTYMVPANLLSNPFPNGVVKPTNGSLGPLTNVGLGVNFVPRIAPDMTTYNFNFGLQYEFPGQTLLSVAWVGSRGLHLTFSNNAPDLNTISLQQIARYGNNLTNMVPYPYTNAITNPDAPWYGATQVPQWVMLQRFPQFSFDGAGQQEGSGVMDWGDTLGDSIYHSLQAKLEKRLNHGFNSLTSFTWGKLITNDDSGSLTFNGNNYAIPQDWDNLNLERALSTQDIAFWFTEELTYDLPIGQGRAINLSGIPSQVFGGWTVSAIAAFSDGQPIATPNGTLNPWFNQRPNLASHNCGANAPRTINEWFNYACMSEPTNLYAAGTMGAILPGIRADGEHNLDLGLAKTFKIASAKQLMVRAEAYNITNSVQFGYPNVFWAPENFGQQPSPSDQEGFGQITNQANNPRFMSFEARFTF